MTMFMIRPELHRANEADYQKLHPLMASRGFLRQIVADDGRKFWLPVSRIRHRDRDVARPGTGRCKSMRSSGGGELCGGVRVATGVTWDGLPPA